jgi:hypothetical protein
MTSKLEEIECLIDAVDKANAKAVKLGLTTTAYLLQMARLDLQTSVEDVVETPKPLVQTPIS